MDYLLSLIIPTYNCAPYLRETLASVLNSLPDNVELIVADDGSDPETLQILRAFSEKSQKLKTIYREHQGAGAARNAGLHAANGKYIAFMDCDDRLKDGFLEQALALLKEDADLFIFSFDRVEENGETSPLSVEDHTYTCASDFADEYIRNLHLLIYSACNKFYKKELLSANIIRFREDLAFGEDRLFNYCYLKHCGRIVSSSRKMVDYMQRNADSQSKKSFPKYYETILMLNGAKMDCFLHLSKGTSLEEKADFVGYDLSTEIKRMIDRFDEHPDEKAENLPKINLLLFGETADISGHFDYVIVLGSRDCAYRAKRAFALDGADPGSVFVVSGGNMHKDGEKTEAGFMADYLRAQGIADDRIIVEDSADNTFQNLEFSADLMEARIKSFGQAADQVRIGIVTAGFHVKRTGMWKDKIPWFSDKNIVFIPAYGEHTRPDNWYFDPYGLKIGLSEIAKIAGAIYSANAQEA